MQEQTPSRFCRCLQAPRRAPKWAPLRLIRRLASRAERTRINLHSAVRLPIHIPALKAIRLAVARYVVRRVERLVLLPINKRTEPVAANRTDRAIQVEAAVTEGRYPAVMVVVSRTLVSSAAMVGACAALRASLRHRIRETLQIRKYVAPPAR